MSSMNMNINDSYAVGKPRACIMSNRIAVAGVQEFTNPTRYPLRQKAK
jgi:hypothetical protein